MSYKVVFYSYNDKMPMDEILEELSKNEKLEAKFFRELELLQLFGHLEEPHVKALENGIFELRIIQGNNHARTFFFYMVGKQIIMTHGFIKKTNKTPRAELNKALEYKKEFEGRKNNGL
jgi:phage-related protein